MNPGDAADHGLDEALRAAAGLVLVTAARLQEALPGLGRVIDDVAGDWSDDAGRAWAERARLVRRVLDRELEATVAVGRLLAAAATGPVDASVDGPVASGPSGSGPRLGGTGARRVDDERGMSIARLSDDGR
ncbi:WXG100 family type VII secretion target [Pseudonocardia hydrocarbonoxydans]|uniref:Uncharacterized protein n=1 Tax=Pseudonocardia hydrocarbonoxydans TaxID=76726 RepID=A0A4Y3WSP1_9PSEU|nr:hypothetical protein [Pseudonocardia hydrocarbonoxydans]GEC20376.1 hypothetical protein PHY01_26590 [Pseudonocardia hydrocarbonoxydans]